MLVSRFRILCGVTVLVCGVGLKASCAQGGATSPQTPTAPPSAGASAPGNDSLSGPLRKADAIRVVVAGEDTMGGEFRIDNDGSVSIPRLGSFSIAGKMQAEAAQMIAQKIEARQLLKHADVTVYIIGRKIRTVVINGAITTQGPQTIKDNTVLSEVLEASTPSLGADLSRVIITHSDGTTQTVNYKRFRNGEANSAEVNPPLVDDDHIYVYSANPSEGAVRVVGEAKDQTKLLIPITAGMTAGQVLQMVGGVSEYADRNGIYLTRAGQTIPISYDDILRNAQGKDIVLLDHDEIHIPRLDKPRQISVIGAVRDPKNEPLLTRLTLLEAVSQAGGPMDGAQQNKVELRRSSENGKGLTTRVYDITKDSDAATELLDGDIVSVPYERHRSHLDAGVVIGVLSGLAVLFSVFR